MRILDEKTVVRYHVEYDEQETLALKAIGGWPLYAEPRARLWSTQTEIDETEKLLAQAKGARS